jgi:hypothetical protein
MGSEVTSFAVPTSRARASRGRNDLPPPPSLFAIVFHIPPTFMRIATCYSHSTATAAEPPKNIPTTFDIAITRAGGVDSSSTRPYPYLGPILKVEAVCLPSKRPNLSNANERQAGSGSQKHGVVHAAIRPSFGWSDGGDN